MSDDRFHDLFNRYYRSVFAYFVRLGFPRDLARDLTQETFHRVYRRMDNYRGDAEWGFLKVTAHNLALNEIRSRQTQKRFAVEVPLEVLSYLPDSMARDPWTSQAPASPEEELIDQEEAADRRRRLREAMAELPEGIRDCLLLRLAGHKYRDIQQRLDISLDAVKSRLHEARNRLRARLTEEPEGIAWPSPPGEHDHDQED